MLTERLRKLEQYVRDYREERIKWARIEGIDGYTLEYFKLQEEVERLERVKEKGLELTLDQYKKINAFRARYSKRHG